MRCELDIEKHLWVTASMWNMLQPQCDCIKVSFSVDCLSRSAIARCLTVSVPVSPALHPLRMSVNPHDPELLLVTWEWTFTRDWEKDTRSWLDLPGKNRVWYSMAEWNHKKVTMDKTVWNQCQRKEWSQPQVPWWVCFLLHPLQCLLIVQSFDNSAVLTAC